MNKKTKILLGVGALAVVAYLVYKNNKPKANATGRNTKLSQFGSMGNTIFDGGYSTNIKDECLCHTDVKTFKRQDGTEVTEYTCKNGEHSSKSKGACK
jgi:hypothetical protein